MNFNRIIDRFHNVVIAPLCDVLAETLAALKCQIQHENGCLRDVYREI